jgi:hypothetical protein
LKLCPSRTLRNATRSFLLKTLLQQTPKRNSSFDEGARNSNIENGQTKALIPKRRPKSAIRKGLPESLPTSVQKSYFMLGDKERDVLNRALEKYRPGRSEPIFIGAADALKPALPLMNVFRLRIDEIIEDVVVTSYTGGWNRCKCGDRKTRKSS